MLAYVVDVKIGDWLEKLNLMVVPLDDFDGTVGNDWFMNVNMVLTSHLGRLLYG